MMPATKQQSLVTRGRPFLRWIQRFLFVTGALAVSYVALTVLYAKHYQEAAGNTLEKQIYAQEKQNVSLTSVDIKEGDVLGLIEIPRLGVKIAILQGTTAETLRLGVGHIAAQLSPESQGTPESPAIAIPTFGRSRIYVLVTRFRFKPRPVFQATRSIQSRSSHLTTSGSCLPRQDLRLHL